jgi:16S rRNA (guanine(966)-N(2))-methyltransferase RsmD
VLDCKIQGGLRPSFEKYRQALFNILGNRLEGVRVLDLCSGTGIIGFEALSRGAEFVLCVEKDSKHAKAIQENAKKFSIPETQMKVLSQSVERVLPRLKGQTFDLIYLDPPFFQDSENLYLICASLIRQSNLLAPEGLLVTEFHATRPVDLNPLGFEQNKERVFGTVALRFWKTK